MSGSRKHASNRRQFLVGTASVASSFGLAPLVPALAQDSPGSAGARHLQELQTLEETAGRVGVRAAAAARTAPVSPQEQELYSELMPRLVDLIERSTAAGPSGKDIVEAASELLSRVNRAERGEPPSDDLARKAPPAFDDLQKDYRQQFETCTIHPQRQAKVAGNVEMLAKFRPRYEQVANTLNIPWYFIGIIHALEASFNFNGHLHNGDYPLTRKTRNVPANRPLVWNPPTDWESSAEDALRMKGYDKQTDWSLERVLYRWEQYNGFGYYWREVKTPYLWSFSNHYVKGKYVSDGRYDANYVSQQCGAAVTLKALVEAGVVQLQQPAPAEQAKQPEPQKGPEEQKQPPAGGQKQ
jgi:lysozyme family protein